MNPQNPTPTVETPQTETENVGHKYLSPAQDDYITYVAANGFVVNEDGVEAKKLKVTEFAERVGVHRDTLYDWQKRIPNFWDLVDARSKEIFKKNRKYVILNGLFLRAAKGDSKQAEMLLSHFDNYIPPTQRHEVKVSGLADLAKIARNKKEIPDERPTS